MKWEQDYQTRKFTPISPTKMREFGLNKDSSKFVETIEDLETKTPNIIIAQATDDLTFVQNNFKQQILVKKNNYVMGLGVFQQLFVDPRFNNKNKFLLKPTPFKFKNLYRPYKGQDLSNKSILVFRTGGIGDLIFIQPNLYYLKEKYPTCTIKFACGPQYQSMVETWECIDEVLDLPFHVNHLKNSDYHALFEGVIERCNEAKQKNAFNLFSKWMGLDLPNDKLIPKQIPKKEKVEYCIEKLNNWNINQKDFLLLQLRASSPIRTPRISFWLNMINYLTDKGYNVILTDTPTQSKQIDNFIKECKNKNKVFNFSQYSLSLDYSIALTSLAKCVIATDSAMCHIAASLGVKLFGIYGPFPGEIRLKTYGDLASWADAQRDCAPCFIHSHNPCPKSIDGVSPCYDNIDVLKTCDKIMEHIKND